MTLPLMLLKEYCDGDAEPHRKSEFRLRDAYWTRNEAGERVFMLETDVIRGPAAGRRMLNLELNGAAMRSVIHGEGQPEAARRDAGRMP